MTPAACATRLAELFPALFGREGPPKPIKLRIHADLQQRAPGVFPRRALSAFLARHTTTNAYLRALVQAPHRFDLDGQPAGEVADVHRQAAQEELQRRRAMRPAPGGRPPRVPSHPKDRSAGSLGPAEDAANRGGDDTRPGSPRRRARPDEVGTRPDPRPGSRPPRAAREAHGPAGDARKRPRPPAPAGPAATPSTGAGAAAPGASFDPAQRARLALVRAWETSPLTKSNFCVLMRVSASELDEAVEQVRQERRARADAGPSR